jgi:hypothetical protein
MSRSHGQGIAAALIEQVSALTGPGTLLLHMQEREWASATFTGARYRLELAVPVGAGNRPSLLTAMAALPDHEFDLRGVIVADCTASMGGILPNAGPERLRAVTVEILTVAAD